LQRRPPLRSYNAVCNGGVPCWCQPRSTGLDSGCAPSAGCRSFEKGARRVTRRKLCEGSTGDPAQENRREPASQPARNLPGAGSRREPAAAGGPPAKICLSEPAGEPATLSRGRRRPHSAPRPRARRGGRALAARHLCAARAAVPRPVAVADTLWCPQTCFGPAHGARWPRARPSGISRRVRRWRSWPRPSLPRSPNRAPRAAVFRLAEAVREGRT
jgi:hypothetical protein